MKMLSSCMYVKELSICFSVAIILTIPHCEYGLTVVATKREASAHEKHNCMQYSNYNALGIRSIILNFIILKIKHTFKLVSSPEVNLN